MDTFYDRTVQPDTRYTYYVRSQNAAGESKPSKSVHVKTIAVATSETPTNVTDSVYRFDAGPVNLVN